MTYLVIGGAFVFGVGVGVVLAAADWCARWERERMGYVDLTQKRPNFDDLPTYRKDKAWWT
jgi:hypothetical protein